MARYPGATWRPVARYLPGGSANQDMARHDAVVVHIEDAEWTRDEAFAHYNTPGNAIPHFRVHLPTAMIDQYVDTAFRSSATLEGNDRVIAIEMWGLGHGDAADKLPADAAEALAQFQAWCCRTHNIPAIEMADSRPASQGLAWHRRGIDGNFPTAPGTLMGGRVTDGEHWTTSFGKTCPTSPIIRQLHEQIIPRTIEIVEGVDVIPTEQEDRIVARTAAAVIKMLHDPIWVNPVNPTGGKWSTDTVIDSQDNLARMTRDNTQILRGKTDDLITKVDTISDEVLADRTVIVNVDEATLKAAFVAALRELVTP